LLGCFVAESGQYFAPEGIGKTRAEGGDDEADGVRTLPLELLGGGVRIVAHLERGLLDPLASLVGDVGVSSQGTVVIEISRCWAMSFNLTGILDLVPLGHVSQNALEVSPLYS